MCLLSSKKMQKNQTSVAIQSSLQTADQVKGDVIGIGYTFMNIAEALIRKLSQPPYIC